MLVVNGFLYRAEHALQVPPHELKTAPDSDTLALAHAGLRQAEHVKVVHVHDGIRVARRDEQSLDYSPRLSGKTSQYL